MSWTDAQHALVVETVQNHGRPQDGYDSYLLEQVLYVDEGWGTGVPSRNVLIVDTSTVAGKR